LRPGRGGAAAGELGRLRELGLGPRMKEICNFVFVFSKELLHVLGRAEHLTSSAVSWAFRQKWQDALGSFGFSFIFFFSEAYLNVILMKFV
jgi:hypothetical protein